MTEEPRIGVYICRCGGNISDVVDVEEVTKAASKLPNVMVAREYTFMCSDTGQGMIKEDIQKRKLTGIVVAACSPSLHEMTFRRAVEEAGLNQYQYEHANIREQDSWVHKKRPEKATEKASILVRMAVAKARLLEPLAPIKVEVTPQVAVIGAGISGLRAAADLAEKGLSVHLIERTAFVGGRMAQLDKVFPIETSATELLQELVKDVSSRPNVVLYTNAEVESIDGYVGAFDLRLKVKPRFVTSKCLDFDKAMEVCPVEVPDEFNYGLSKRKAIYMPYRKAYPPLPAIDADACTLCNKCVDAVGSEAIDLSQTEEEFTLQVGSIVLATGFDPYEPKPGEYGYGLNEKVVTLPQLIRLMSPNGPAAGNLSIDSREIKNVVMIHCVGSRQTSATNQPNDNGRLNEYCSRYCCTATLHAALDLKSWDPDINVYDLYQDIRTYGSHESYYERASEVGVLFFRYLPEEPPEVEMSDDGGSLVVKVKDQLTYGEELEIPADLVVLAVGMVPRAQRELVSMLKLPIGTDGFVLEVHPKLRPVEIATPGIMLAGTVQGPKDTTESSLAASAAAAKAAVILSKDYTELEPFVAAVDPEKCEGTGLCIQECLYEGAIQLVDVKTNRDVMKRASINPAICKGCGACVAVCPNQAINVKGWTIQQFNAIVDAIAETA